MSDEPLFHSVHFPAWLSLQAINDELVFYETNSGLLVEMRLDNDTSFFKFDARAKRPPKAFAKVARQVGGKPQVPDGAKLVVSGRIFIEGEQVLCAATRGP